MVEVPASAAIFLVDSAWAPCSARSLAAMSTSVVRISGSSFRGLTLTVLHNVVIVYLTTLCYTEETVMSALVREPAAMQAPAAALAFAFDRPRRVELLRVDGVLPVGLEGLFAQAGPHPLDAHQLGHPDLDGGLGVVSGVRLNNGTARWYRAATEHPRAGLFGSVPALAPAVHLGRHGPDGRSQSALARPVADPEGRWHSIATYPGLGYAEHVVADSDGTVLRARPFPLAGSPLVSSVALTDSYVVLVGLPVAFSRAAAMVGERLPYTWQPGRKARVGLLPRTGTDPRARWFPVEPCYVCDIANVYQDGRLVIVD